jgi:hypothetical protein
MTTFAVPQPGHRELSYEEMVAALLALPGPDGEPVRFNPQQPRHPSGSSKGGQFASGASGDGGGEQGHPDQKAHGRRKGGTAIGWAEIRRHRQELEEKIRRKYPGIGGINLVRAEMMTYGDIEAAALFELAGYCGKPTVLSRDAFEAFKGKEIVYGFSSPGYVPGPRTLFGRGFSARINRLDTEGKGDKETWVPGADSARYLMTSDDYWVGSGIFTSGTYIGTPSVGTEFDGGGPTKTHSTIDGDSAYLAVKIKPEAKVIDWDDLTTMSYDGDTMPQNLDSTTILRDAIAQGAQVINTSNVWDPLAGIVVLDRSVMVIEEFQ